MQEKFEAMIYAYSIGCLNEESKKEFLKYMASVEDFNFSELGEMQNLAALIPGALQLQEVSPAVKDKVAKRLYGLRNDIKKIRSRYKQIDEDVIEPYVKQTPECANDEVIPAPLPEKEQVVNNEVLDYRPGRTSESLRPSHQTQIRGRESGNVFTPYAEVSDSLYNISGNDLVNDSGIFIDNVENTGYLPQTAEPDNSQKFYKGPEANNNKTGKSYGLVILSFILFFTVVIGVVFIYFKLTAEVKNNKREVESLKGTIKNMAMQSGGNSEIQQIMQSSNVAVVNLKGTDLNRSGFGKLIIDRETGKGLIQFSQMPALVKDQSYVLWLEMSGSFIKIGSFAPIDNIGYYSFNYSRLQNGMTVYFKVTKEISSDVKHPGNGIFLTGVL